MWGGGGGVVVWGFFCLKQFWPLKNRLPVPVLVKGVRTSLPNILYLLAPSSSALGLLLKTLLPLILQSTLISSIREHLQFSQGLLLSKPASAADENVCSR